MALKLVGYLLRPGVDVFTQRLPQLSRVPGFHRLPPVWCRAEIAEVLEELSWRADAAQNPLTRRETILAA